MIDNFTTLVDVNNIQQYDITFQLNNFSVKLYKYKGSAAEDLRWAAGFIILAVHLWLQHKITQNWSIFDKIILKIKLANVLQSTV